MSGMFFGYPFSLLSNGMSHSNEKGEDLTPTRVQLAVGLIRHFHEQMADKIAVTDTSSESYEGRKLEVEEQEVFMNSCKLVTAYLRGQFVPTEEEKQARAVGEQKRRTYLRCPQCGGARHVALGKRCDLCEGSGSVYCEPANCAGE